MTESPFRTPDGRPVPAVTAAEMREVDRIAVEEVGLSVLMMMEHAGRGLAETVQAAAPDGPVAVLAGGGGNGGGGLCAARHLANHGREVSVVLDREPAELSGPPRRQWRVLGDTPAELGADPAVAIDGADLVVDALVGYSLEGGLRGRAAELAERVDAANAVVVSLDVPSGVDATTGERLGPAVEPHVTLTLARPKTGLAALDGDLHLADIGIPRGVYRHAGLADESPFEAGRWRVPLEVGGA